ncbi:MAG: tRNA (guanosine(46)-N7)-methyltransferase TrmB [Alphaproteobacteria bacterium]
MSSERVLFGRRKGKPLSARRRKLMATLYPVLHIELDRPEQTPAALFADPRDRLVLEIGFGGGEHLVAAATANPGTGYLGVEPFVNGLARAVSEIDRLGLTNIRLFDDDAGLLMDSLPASVVDTVELPFPDPWPKRRHWKRRFVRPANLDRLARILKPGGTLLIATDVPAYAEWSLAQVRGHGAFRWTARCADDWRQPPGDWIPTRYEGKAVLAGRRPVYLRFARR